MKIIFVAQGSYGDVIPMLKVAIVAANAGFEVEFIAYSFFKEFVESRAKNITFVGVCTVDMYKEMVSVDTSLTEDHIVLHHFNSCGQHAIEPIFDYIKSCASKDACILVGYTFCTGAVWAAKKFDIPFVRMILSSAELEPAADTGAKAEEPNSIFVDAIAFGEFLYKKFDLPGEMDWKMDFKTNICLFPSIFVSDAAKASIEINNYNFLGFLPRDAQVPREASLQPHKYFVYTSGTAFASSLNDFIVFDSLCELFGMEGLFISQNRLFDSAGLIQNRVKILDFCDLPNIITEAKLVISHGGIGTISDAMMAGLPQLVVPKAFDQFHNARMIVNLGFGQKLDADQFSLGGGLQQVVATALASAETLKESVKKYQLNNFRHEVLLETLSKMVHRGAPQ